MVGGLAHENHGLQAGSPPITEEQLDTFLKAGFGERAAQVKSNYSDMLALSPLDARKQVATDNGFLLSSRMWGRLVQQRGNNAYVYLFMREPPAFRLYMPEQPDLNSDGGQRSYGAYHSGELAFVFDNLDLVGIGWDAEDHALSELVADYWVSFASNGNPNADGLPIWPAYNASEDRVQILDRKAEGW